LITNRAIKKCLFIAASMAITMPALSAENCTFQFDNGETLRMPVARTLEQQSAGLRNVEPDAIAAGLAFVWSEPNFRFVWTRDAPALSVAWLDHNGVVLSVQELPANSSEMYSSAAPAMAVLELAPGGFSRLGISPGSRVVSSSCLRLAP